MSLFEDAQRGPFTIWVKDNDAWKPQECATLDDVYDAMRRLELFGHKYRVTRDVEFTVAWPGMRKAKAST